MLNGRKDADLSKDHVHKIKHDGRTIILRTNKKLSDKEVRQMVAEAEKSRLAADKALRESGLDRDICGIDHAERLNGNSSRPEGKCSKNCGKRIGRFVKRCKQAP